MPEKTPRIEIKNKDPFDFSQARLESGDAAAASTMEINAKKGPDLNKRPVAILMLAQMAGPPLRGTLGNNFSFEKKGNDYLIYRNGKKLHTITAAEVKTAKTILSQKKRSILDEF